MSWKSRLKFGAAGAALWGKVLMLIGFVAIFFTGAPRMFHQQSDNTIVGPDSAHADACSGCVGGCSCECGPCACDGGGGGGG